MGVAFSFITTVVEKCKNCISIDKTVKCEFIFHLTTNFTATFLLLSLAVMIGSCGIFSSINCRDTIDADIPKIWNSYCWERETFLVPKKDTVYEPDRTIQLAYHNKIWLPLGASSVFAYISYLFFKVKIVYSRL